MQASLINVLVSPDSGKPLKLAEKLRDEREVLEGSLICEKSDQCFPIKNGIPYFAPEAATTNVTAQRFGYQWKQQAKGLFEKSNIYGESSNQELENFLHATRLTTNDLHGMRIADIGCAGDDCLGL